MKKKLMWIPGFVLIAVIVMGFYPGRGDIYFEIAKNLDLLGRVYKEIAFNYVDEVDPEKFLRAGIQGMLSSLDPYTIFIDEKKIEDIDLITNGKYGGVGISIGLRGDEVTVVEVMDGYAAQRQGIQIGDVIIEAAGSAITVDNIDDVSSLVKGEPGTTVELKVIRNELKDTLTFNLIREEVIVKNITYSGFFPENSNNAYIKLSNFSRAASDEIKKTIKELKEQKPVKSVVLDLRGNPGGLLDIAIDICDKFLARDLLVVSTRGREAGSDKKYYSVEEPIIGNEVGIVVLINGGSASASEIVAGALQDHDRAVILGTKSFGKGLVQTITPLSYNTSLKITTAKYYTPSGRSIQKIDYSEGSDVILNPTHESEQLFLTDNKREVHSKGGITPDTTVEFKINGELTKELLAKGLFFKFANNYFFDNPDAKYSNIDDQKLYNKFREYLTKEDFKYTSQTEIEIDNLIKGAADKEEIKDELLKIKDSLKGLFEKELQIYKSEILREIRSELAARYLGVEGRIKEQLTSDLQIQTALEILGNTNTYNKLLNFNAR
ncbi:MAG: S41 family peptidase [Ignavibacteriaceae bacterium]|nr:S41 family peptidase [Ignavibacteriaceae bacterium]MCU0364223.1 S41 family peptidase [Ignavibacteriaceae bacterium]MCU0405972.1 S41 family peptidase [Ignavibacteriaceae bacterium]